MSAAADSYRWLAAGGAALVVAPSTAWAVVIRTSGYLPDELAFTALSDAALVVLVSILAAAALALAGGVIAAIRLSRGEPPHRRFGRRWLIAVGVALSACTFPPFWFLSTPWMFLGCVLATRPVWWQLQGQPPVSTAAARACLSATVRRATVLAVVSHAMAWLTVIAVAWPVAPAEFARVEAERTARALGQRQSRQLEGGGIDFIEMTTGRGTIAAGRYVLGDMSATQFTIGLWPYLAHLLVVPDIDDDPTEHESWLVAGVAFVASMAFWTPWVILFVWLRSRDVRLAAGMT